MVDWKVGELYLSEQDDVIKALINKYGHCDLTPLTSEDYFTTLIKGIISQQLSQQAAASIYQKVRSYYGSELLYADKIAATSAEQLKDLGLSMQKTSYILDLSQHVADGRINPDEFTVMSDTEIMNQLLPVKGFGRWTVEMFLIFALNRTNVWPIDDFGIKKAMNMLYAVDMKAKRTVYNELAHKWEPWRTLATWYLWKYYSEHK